MSSAWVGHLLKTLKSWVKSEVDIPHARRELYAALCVMCSLGPLLFSEEID